MSTIVTSTASPARGRFPTKAGYTHGFVFLAAAAFLATLAAAAVPTRRVRSDASLHERRPSEETLPHAELGIVAAGSLAGDEPE
jgi:hypothetical protein